jgi:L-methionine (R)-S-oxide reductase
VAEFEIPEEALEEKFLAATGPGGQNVNKVATACQLRCDTFRLDLRPDVRERLATLAGSRMTLDGVIVITARGARSQEANQEDQDQARAGGQGAPGRFQEAARHGQGHSRRRSAGLGARMYDFKVSAAAKPDLYRELVAAADALTAGEPDPIANMANLAALIWESLPDLNWAGFYRVVDGELVLGPFQGRPACIRIPFGKGVCGAAAATRTPQRVADVHAFPGHIACDAASRSELVVPILVGDSLIGVLDLDSPSPGRFDQEDEAGCVELVQRLSGRLATVSKPSPGS